MVVNNLWVAKLLVVLVLFVAVPFECFLCTRKQYYIPRLFHTVNVELNIVHFTSPCVCCPNGLILEVFLDVITENILWPVPPFLISMEANTPFFLSSISSFNTQKPLSRITVLPEPQIGFINLISRPTIFLQSSYSFVQRSSRSSFPSTSSTWYIIPEIAQQMV